MDGEFAGCADKGMRTLWDVGNLHGPIASMALSPGGIVALGSDDGSVKQWNIGTAAATAPLPGGRPSYGTPLTEAGAAVGAVTFASDEQQVIAGDGAGRVEVWRLDEARSETTLKASDNAIVSINAADQQVVFADTSFGGNVHLWNMDTDQVSQAFATDLWGVTTVLIHPDGDLLAAGDEYGEPLIERHAAATPDARSRDAWLGQGRVGSIRHAVVSPDGTQVIVAADGFIGVLEAARLHAGLVANVDLAGVSSSSVAVSPSGGYVASVGDDGMVRLWRTDDLSPVAVMPVTDAMSVVVDAAGTRVVVAGRDGQLRALGCDL